MLLHLDLSLCWLFFCLFSLSCRVSEAAAHPLRVSSECFRQLQRSSAHLGHSPSSLLAPPPCTQREVTVRRACRAQPPQPLPHTRAMQSVQPPLQQRHRAQLVQLAHSMVAAAPPLSLPVPVPLPRPSPPLPRSFPSPSLSLPTRSSTRSCRTSFTRCSRDKDTCASSRARREQVRGSDRATTAVRTCQHTVPALWLSAPLIGAEQRGHQRPAAEH